MRHKSEALDIFKVYTIEIENQFGKKIKKFRSDRGTNTVLLNLLSCMKLLA